MKWSLPGPWTRDRLTPPFPKDGLNRRKRQGRKVAPVAATDRGRTIRATRSELLDELFGPRGAPGTLAERLLRTSDVAALFQVSERTVSEWGRRGRIPSVRTPSGHRRYPANAIKELLIAASDGGAVVDDRATPPDG